MGELETISNSGDINPQTFLTIMQEFNAERITAEPTSGIINKGLEVFLSLPNAVSASLFLLNESTFEFHCSLCLPSEEKNEHIRLFDFLMEEGVLASALGLGKIDSGIWEIANKDPYGYMTIPLISVEGVLGLALVHLDNPAYHIEQMTFALCSLHANQYAALLHNAKLSRRLNSVKSELEQKIAIRTESIKKGKRELQLILDSIQTGVIIFDKDTYEIIDANMMAAEMTGISKKDLIGKNRNDFIFAVSRNGKNNGIGSTELSSLECLLRASDGFEIPILKKLNEIGLGGNEYYLESFLDITASKEAERAVRESESRFRTIFEHAGIGMTLTNLKGRITHTNPAVERMFGYSKEQLHERTIFDLTHPEDMEDDKEQFAIESKQQDESPTHTSVRRYINREGEIIWGRLTSTFIRDNQNRAIFGVGMIEDVTEQKRHELALQRQTNLLNGVADATNALLVSPDFSEAIQQALRSLGRAAEVDQVYIFENHTDPETGDLRMSQSYLWKAAKDEILLNREEFQNLSYKRYFSRWLSLLQEGQTVSSNVDKLPETEQAILEASGVMSVLIVPIIMQDEFWGLLGFDDCKAKRAWSEAEESILKATATSIGGAIQRERTNMALIESKQEAEEASKLKSSLLANMSHEFRTPLNGIFGFAQILQDELTDREHHEMAENIIEASHRLMTTLNSILYLSEVESRKLDTSLVELNLSEAAAYATSLFEHDAFEKDLNLSVDIIDSAVKGMVDKNLFYQVLNNLIDNAIKYTEQGNVTIQTDSLHENGTTYGIVRVIDSGIGIPDDQKELIFHEFRQASEGLSRRFEGSGLGLTLAQRMMELMGGDIFLESEVGVGSTFTVKVPGLQASNGNGDKEAARKINITADIDEPEEMKNILVVEDNENNKEVIRIYLKKLCNVDYAPDGPAALELASEKQFSAVLMDINLGEGINGIETAKRIKTIDGYSEVPIIAITGYALYGDRERLLELGFSNYLAKPFKKSELFDLLKDILY